MDEADEELRQTLKKIWPLKAKKNMIDLVVPPNHGTFILGWERAVETYVPEPFTDRRQRRAIGAELSLHVHVFMLIIPYTFEDTFCGTESL